MGEWLVTDVLQGSRSEPLRQLGEIKAARLNGCAVRILDALGQQGCRVEWARHGFATAHAADHPISGPGRRLDDEVFRFTIPGDAPTHAPAMPGTHRAAVAEIDASIRHAAIVVEHRGRPALMRLDPAIAAECAIQHDNWPRDLAPDPSVPDIVTRAGTAIEQKLAGIRRELRRLG